MARWEGNAQTRLEQAALELFGEQGFAATTVADIAARAGLTPRTLFRYFADKREIVFAGQLALEETCRRAVEGAAADSGPVELVAAALDAAAALLGGRGSRTLRRHEVVAASPELRERALLKEADLTAALAAALRGRDVPEPSASLIAEVGVAIQRVSLARWAAAPNGPGLVDLVRDSLFQLADLTAGA